MYVSAVLTRATDRGRRSGPRRAVRPGTSRRATGGADRATRAGPGAGRRCAGCSGPRTAAAAGAGCWMMMIVEVLLTSRAGGSGSRRSASAARPLASARRRTRRGHRRTHLEGGRHGGVSTLTTDASLRLLVRVGTGPQVAARTRDEEGPASADSPPLRRPATPRANCVRTPWAAPRGDRIRSSR